MHLNSLVCLQEVTWVVTLDEPVCSDFSVTANDACDGPVSVTCTAGEISDQGTCGKSQTFYFYAVDLCDNGKTETATFTWKVDDTDAPEFTGVPAGSNLGCNPDEPVCSDFSVTANDACDGPVSVTCTAGEISDQGTCGKSQTFYFYAVDLCDNGKTETATFTWKVDTDAPEFTGVPAGSNLGCNPTEPVCSDFSVTANDACDGPVSVTCTAGEISDQGTCGKSQTFYFYAVDLCDNGKTETATFTWKVDTDAPEFTGVPAGSNLGCNPTEPVCSDFSVTANDNCDGPVSVTCTAGEISDQGTCGKSQTFYFYAVDLCDNGKTETATFTWKVDTDAPEFTGVPAGSNLGCNPDEPVCSDFSVTANDACDGPVSVTCTAGEISDQGTCGKSQTFYFYAVDLCDNGKTETATFTWKVDTDAPEFTGVPAGSNLGCNPDEPVCSDFSVTANDNCDGPVSVTCTAGEISDQGTCGKSQTFYFYAVDLCDNGKTETATFTWKADLTAPEFTGIPAGGDLGCNPTPPSCDDGVTATDACDGPVSVTCSAGEITKVDFTCYKSQTFYYYAIDLCGNGKTETATYTWKADLTAPEFTGIPAGGDLGCNPTPPTCDDGVTATDECDGPVSVTCTAGDIADQGNCGKSQTFYYYAVDLCGNGKTVTASYTWKVDTDEPELTGVPAGGDLGCNPDPPTCDDGVTATDDCDGALSVICTAGEITNVYSDIVSCDKSQTFYYYAVDLCGNGKTETATYTWTEDTEDPTLTCPDNITIVCGTTLPAYYTNYGDFVTAGGLAEDNCGVDEASFTWVSDVSDGNTDPEVITRTYKIWDYCDNYGTCEQTITIISVDLDTRVYLDGSAINPGGIEDYTIPMRTSLNNLKALPGQTYTNFFTGTVYSPPGQPYSGAPWFYGGTEGDGYDSYGDPTPGTANYPATVTDWVLVSLRESPDGEPLCMKAALLHNDGHIEFVEGGFDCCNLQINNPYYVVIEHRNHLIVMSDESVPIVDGTITYDFTDQESYIDDPFGFGGYGQKEIMSGVFAMFAGNGNQTSVPTSDTDINFDDRTYWEGQNGITGRYRNGDYNLNGDCNYNDRTTWEFNNGIFSTVPRD